MKGMTSQPLGDPPTPTTMQSWWSLHSPQKYPAVWLAVVGSVLVMVASITSTLASWDNISIPMRLAMLVTVHTLLVGGAAIGRRSIPSVSVVVAYLGAALFLATGISTTAALHGSWRSCIVVGGLAAIGASESFSRWWSQRAMVALQVPALALACAGVAASTHVPIGLLLGLSAAVVALLGSTRRAAAVAGLAALVPLLAVVGRSDVGPGTIAELGASVDRLTLSAPLAGLLSAITFVVLHRRSRRTEFLWAALAASVFGMAVGAATGNWLDQLSPLLALGIAMLVVPNVAGHVVGRGIDKPKWLSQTFQWADVLEIVGFIVLLGPAFDHDEIVFVAGLPAWLLSVTRQRSVSPRWLAAVFGCAHVAVSAFVLSHRADASLWIAIVGCLIIARFERIKLLEAIATAAVPVMFAGQFIGFTRPEWLSVSQLGVAMLLVGIATTMWSYIVTRRMVGLIGGLATLSTAAALCGPAWSINAGVCFAVAAAVTFVARETKVFALYCWATALAFGGVVLALFQSDQLQNVWISDANVAVGLISVWLLELTKQRNKSKNVPQSSELRVRTFFVSSLLTTIYVGLSLLVEHGSAHLAAAMLVGVGLLIAGGLQRMPAPIVAGTGIVVSTLVIAGRVRLAALPLWTWVLVGGLVLIGVAVHVERRSKRSV
jgi:hypothetical protein